MDQKKKATKSTIKFISRINTGKWMLAPWSLNEEKNIEKDRHTYIQTHKDHSINTTYLTLD